MEVVMNATLPVTSGIVLVAALPKWSSIWTYVMFGALLLAIVMGTWAGAVAGGKGRSMQKWFLLGFFVPLVGLIAAYIVKPVVPEKKKAEDNKTQP
jgi:hypothetical protein